jgi:hypothetical protein
LGPYQQHPALADPVSVGEAVASFLHQHGFESRVEAGLIHANAGKCRMLISEADPYGWNRSGIELLARGVGRLNYVFDGAVQQREPFLAPMIYEYWTRIGIKIGLTPSHHPVLAVAASDNCSMNELPWWELWRISPSCRS